ncbi:MAG: formylglycine-generating enzyme family protein [Acidobacteriota bacterium]
MNADPSSTRRLLVTAMATILAGAVPWASAQTQAIVKERSIMVGRPAGEAKRVGPADTNAVWIPAGRFTMGCVASDPDCFPDEKPPHQVTLAGGFWLDATEVTVASFRRFTHATGYAQPPAASFPQGDAHPVVNVTWDDAVAYCRWNGGRLPTEAEWEYAARAGAEGTVFPSGAAIGHDAANYEGAEGRDRWTRTAPVGSFDPNAWGAVDLLGNVWEWTQDWYDPHAYSTSAAPDPHGPPTGSLRVIRGGGWNSQPRSLRLSNRGKFAPAARSEALGLRCAYDPTPEDAGAASVERVPAPQMAPAPALTPSASPPPPPSSSSPLAAAAAPTAVAPPPPPPGRVATAATAGTRRSFPPSGSEMAWVPPGTFEMGAVRGDGSGFADEQPRHEVALTRGFWIDTTEVTFAEYRRFAEAAGAAMPRLPNWADDTHPVVNVTWQNAVDYCRWTGGRLPTEAEWEYAARGGTSGLRYPWGDDISHDDANFDGTGGRDQWAKSSPVRSFPPNGFGLYDVAGNAWEWTADWYEDRYYAHSPASDPTGPEVGRARVVRGGCWTSDPGRLRASYRFSLDPSDSQVSVGFRCVRDAP